MEDALAAVAKLEKSIHLLGDEVRTLQTQFKKMAEEVERYKELMRSQNESETTITQMAETEGYLRFSRKVFG